MLSSTKCRQPGLQMPRAKRRMTTSTSSIASGPCLSLPLCLHGNTLCQHVFKDSTLSKVCPLLLVCCHMSACASRQLYRFEYCFPHACTVCLHARGVAEWHARSAADWQELSWLKDTKLARQIQTGRPGAVAQPASYSWAMQLPAWPCASQQRGHLPLRLLLLCFFC